MSEDLFPTCQEADMDAGTLRAIRSIRENNFILGFFGEILASTISKPIPKPPWWQRTKKAIVT